MNSSMILTERELYQNKMRAFIEKSEYKVDYHKIPFETMLGILKAEDKKLEDLGYTDLHFSRYELVKLIEKAEGLC